MNLDGQLVDQLQKAADMVEKIPPTFLFPLVKAGIDTMSALIPEDLTVSATVVGGGATVSKFPPQYLFKAMKFVLETIQLRISNYTSIAGALECDAV